MSLCERYFPSILTGLIRAVVIDRVPSAIRLSISELICDLKSYMSEQFAQWLKKSLVDIPRTNKNGQLEIVTVKQHEEFYKALCE